MKKFLSLVVFSYFLITCQCFAQGGSLDLTFNKTGKVVSDFQTYKGGEGIELARQSNGKIVVAGKYYENNTLILVRYNVDGTIDETFGTLGQVVTSIGMGYDNNLSTVIQGDDKILVATGTSYSKDFTLVRFTSNGTIDISFGINGIVKTKVDADAYHSARALIIQPDAKIILVGNFSFGIAVVRYNSDGSLDNTFSSNGNVKTSGFSIDASAVALQADGKIVVAGYDPGGPGIELLRYNSNGTIDNTFSGDGRVTAGAVGNNIITSSVKIQTNGKIVVAGTTYNSTDCRVIRYNTNGSPDNTFNGNGQLTFKFSINYQSCKSIIIQSDGKLVVAATSAYTDGVTNVASLARFNPNGSFDGTFGTGGKIQTQLVGYDLFVAAAIGQPDGKAVVAGYSSKNGYKTFNVIRYNINGSKDESFSSDGIVITDIGIFDDKVRAVAIQQDGKIVVAGHSFQNTKYKLVLARYNVNGTLDSSFNLTGLLAKEFSRNFIAYALKIQINGKIIAAGYYHNGSNYDFAVVRLNADGTLDNTFSGDGLAVCSFGSSNDYANTVALQADGKIVIAGYFYNGANNDFAIARFNTDGTLDNFFSLDGKVTKGFGTNAIDNATSVIVQSDNKIIVAGHTTDGTNRDIALLRLKPDGSFDNTFSGDAMVTTDINNQRNDIGASLALQPDGKILIAGTTFNGTDNNFVVVRYNTDGVLDNTFDLDGKKTSTFDGTSNDYGSAIALQSDGKIIVGGYSIKSSNQDFALLRLNSDGRPDNTFGNAGKLLTDFDASADVATALAIQPNGKIVLAGYSNNNFAVSRYNPVDLSLSNTLEAELALLNGAIVSSSQAGYTGTGFADYVNATGDYIEWTVNTTVAGSFSLKFRYANGGTTGRPLQLQVNGATVVSSLAFSPTGNWATWSFVSATVNLIAGNNKIKLTAIGSSGPNVDNLSYNNVALPAALQRYSIQANKSISSFITLSAYVTPNPARDFAKVKVVTNSDLPLTVELLDIIGRKYKTIKIPGISEKIDIPINDIPPGSYILMIRQGNQTGNARLIVERK